MRVSDAERDKVAARLREHFAEGRLDADELDERLATTLKAKTFGDLHTVMADLPEPAAPATDTRDPSPQGPRWGYRYHRRGPRLLPVALLVLFAVLALHGGAWALFGLVRVLFVVWLVACLAMFVGARRYRRRMGRTWPR